MSSPKSNEKGELSSTVSTPKTKLVDREQQTEDACDIGTFKGKIKNLLDFTKLAYVTNETEEKIWCAAGSIFLMFCSLNGFTKVYFESEYLTFPIRLMKKTSVPYFCVTLYLMIIFLHAMAFRSKVAMLMRDKRPRNCFIYGIRNDWTVVVSAHLKLWLFVSCSYFIYRIEAVDAANVKEKLNFKECVTLVLGAHLMFFYMHLWLRPNETLSDLFKYVPTLPCVGLICYSVYRCFTSDQIWNLAEEDVGLIANNILLTILFIYEDFFLRSTKTVKYIYFEEDDNLTSTMKDNIDEFNQGVAERAEIERAYAARREKIYFKYKTFRWLLNDFVYPSLFLLQNYLFAHCITLEGHFYYDVARFACSLVILWVYQDTGAMDGFNALPFCQLMCFGSLHMEMPGEPGHEGDYSFFMDYVSAPAFYLIIGLFGWQIFADWSEGRFCEPLDFSRSLYYFLTLRNPGNDWRKTCRSLAYIKNIEDYSVSVNEKGEVTIISDLANEFVPSDEEEVLNVTHEAATMEVKEEIRPAGDGGENTPEDGEGSTGEVVTTSICEANQVIRISTRRNSE